MQYHNTKDQNKGSKASADLASLVATSKTTVNDWSVMSKFLSSQDKEGVYTLQSFEQALELVTIPTFRTVIFLEKKGKKDKTVKITRQVCNEPLDLQQRRYDCVRRTFYTFHAPNTGFPQYLDDLYQPRFNPKQLVELINKELEHGNPAVRSRSHQMIGY